MTDTGVAYCNKLVFYVKYGQKILSKQVNEDNVQQL